MTRAPTAAVVGGGLAGLAAALKLAERGWAVELFEARRALGGRAGSYREASSGEWVDHCQHVAMGCCTNLRDFCRRTGIADCFREDRVLHFFSPDGRGYRVGGVGWLPAPLHLAPSLLRLGFLSWRERLAVARDLPRLARYQPAAEGTEVTMKQWLDERRQSPRARERFWAPVLVSALGETLDRVSASAARKVFVDGFLVDATAYRLHTPLAPLGEVYGQRMITALEQRGATVHLRHPVERLVGDANRVKGLRLDSGEERAFDACVLAVPWRRVNPLLPDWLRSSWDQPERWNQLESSPITAVHLWFDAPIMDLPHAVLLDRLSQWVFRHGDDTSGEASPPSGEPDSFHYQVVISASRQLAGRAREDVLREVLDDLRAIWPRVGNVHLLRWRIVTQADAVFSVRPGVEALRPDQSTPVANLALAGDWTRTGWPATMEGAVRSGYLAAEALLRAHGDPHRCLVDDLPRSWLSRWCLEPRATNRT